MVVVTLEGNFYMFNIFELLQDYEKDRKESDQFNDKEAVIAEARCLEEEDAETLINEVDLDFESHFDANMLLGRRKQSSSNIPGQ